MGANVERPTEAMYGSLLLFISAGLAFFIGIISLVEIGVEALLDVFIGILLILSGYLVYQVRHLTAGTVIALLLGLFVTIFYIGAEIIGYWIFAEGIMPIIAGILGFVARGKSEKTQKMPTDVLGVVKLHERIKISELATRFKTTELEIELQIIKLHERGEPLVFERETREVIYRKQESPAL